MPIGYFIRDMETDQWYMVTDKVRPNDPCGDIPHWTMDIKDATPFNNAKEAIEYMNMGLIRTGENGGFTTNKAFMYDDEAPGHIRNLIILPHQYTEPINKTEPDEHIKPKF